MDDAARRELRRIQRKNGGLLLAEKVVEAARPADSPLHDRFVWDDTAAARLYRLTQAEALIRSYKVVVRPSRTETVTVRRETLPEWSPDPALAKGYRSTLDCLHGPERRPFLAAEWGRCKGHVQRFCDFLAAAGFGDLAGQGQQWLERAKAALDQEVAVEAGN